MTRPIGDLTTNILKLFGMMPNGVLKIKQVHIGLLNVFEMEPKKERVSMRLSRLKRQGVLSNVAHGTYKLTEKE